MSGYREERSFPVEPGVTEVIEERTVDATGATVRRVVVPAPPIEVAAAPPATVAVRPVRRFWRRSWSRRSAGVPYTVPVQAVDPTLAQLFRILWFGLGVLEAMLAVRFLLALLGANPRNAFASLVYAVTWPFTAPFATLFPTPAAGGSVFELTTLIAMLVYFLAWWAIVKTIAVVSNRPVDEVQ